MLGEQCLRKQQRTLPPDPDVLWVWGNNGGEKSAGDDVSSEKLGFG